MGIKYIYARGEIEFTLYFMFDTPIRKFDDEYKEIKYA